MKPLFDTNNIGDVEIVEIDVHDSALGDVSTMLGEVLGTDESDVVRGEVDARGNKLKLGVRLHAYNVHDLYKAKDGVAPDLPVFDSYDIYVMVHHFGVISEIKAKEVLAVRYQARFLSPDYQTIGLSPSLIMESHSHSDLSYRVAVGADGQLNVGEEFLNMVSQGFPIGGGGEIKFDGQVVIEGKKSLGGKKHAAVVAIGHGTNECEWYFSKPEFPLAGHYPLVHTFMIPRHMRSSKKIQFEVRGEITVKKVLQFFPFSQNTGWVQAECDLLRES